MKKKILILIMTISCIFTACAKDEPKSNVKDNNNDTKTNVAQNYVGDCGYITENQVYDYSQYFDKVYDWGHGVKLPFDKPENVSIVWQDVEYPSWNSMTFKGMTIEELDKYIKALENEGYSGFIWREDNRYFYYKDNFRVCISYNEFSDVCYMFCYMGNVVLDREVSAEDARTLIEANELLKGNEYYEDYYVFAIENETVRQAGYYEFLIESGKRSNETYEDDEPFYMLTDGEDILLFEQNGLSIMFPTNVNLVKTGDKEELVVAGVSYGRDYEVCGSHIIGYELKDDKFEKVWEESSYERMDVFPWRQVVLSQVEDGELKYYLLEAVEGYDHKLGTKDYWKIKEEYILERDTVE